MSEERLFGIYSLRDRIADSFRSVNLDVNDAASRRNFAYAVKNSQELEFQAKDLELCRIGSFDSHTGVIIPMSPIQVVCRGDEVLYND